MNKTSVLTLICITIVSVMPLAAEDITHETSAGVDFAYYFDHNRGAKEDGAYEPPSYKPVEKPDDFEGLNGDEGRDLGNGWGALELQGYLEHRMTMPMLVGNGPLTKGNNLKLIFRGNLAPVVAYAQARAVLTPAAFLNFEAGGSVGSGWTMAGINGIGLNTDGTGVSETDPFPGAVVEGWLAGTFQFDLAAVVPGEWNHVVVLANAKLKQQHFTAAEEEEPWTWKADRGENFNGLLYEGSYVLGYQMPLKVNMIGFLTETSQYLGDVQDLSPMGDDGFGSDFVKVTFGPLANIAFTDQHSLTALFQFQTDKRYTEETTHNNWFVTREYDSTFVRFHRVALAYKYKF